MTRRTTPSRTTAFLMVALLLLTFGLLTRGLFAEEPRASDAVSTPFDREAPSAVVPAQSARKSLTAAAAVKKPQRQRNLAELTALRDEMRGLREDVRRLGDLLEKRLTEKAPAPPLANPKTESVVKTPLAPIEDGLLFFNATWCGPCQKLTPIIEKLTREGHPVRNIDIDREMGLAHQFQVTSIPCCVFIKDGKEVDRIAGLTDEKRLRSQLKKPAAKPGEFDLILTVGQPTIHSFQRRVRVIEPDQGAPLSITPLTATEFHFKSEKVGDVTLQILLEGETKPTPLRVHVVANPFEQQLSRKISLKLDKTPLSQAIGEIGSQVDANFAIDKEGLAHEGLSMETPVSLHVSGVSVGSVLKILLEPLHLTFVVENEVIRITSQTLAEPLTVLTYSVADLVAVLPEKLNEEQGAVDAAKKDSAPNDAVALKATKPSPTQAGEQLVKLIQQTVDPDSWDAAGGLGSICLHDSTRSLVVRQTKSSHAEIGRVLNSLRRIQTKAGGNFDFGSLVKESRQESSDRSWQQLGLRLEPLPEGELPKLNPKYRGGMKVVEVKPDSPAARSGFLKDDVLVGLDKWETTNFENVSFILSQPLAKDETEGRSVKFYVVRGSETRYGFLQLAPSQSGAKGKYQVDGKPNSDPKTLVVMTYAVADLVVPLTTTFAEDGKPQQPGASDWLALIDSIVDAVDPETWEENGGPSTIKIYEATLSLVIRAPQATHVKIAELLNQKRREQDVQLVFEMQVLHPAADFSFEKAGLKVSLDEKARVTKLDERDVAKFLDAVREQKVERLSAPKVTTFGGQIAEVQTNGRTAGGNNVDLHWYLRGVATPKRDEIRLNIALNPHHLVYELTSHTHRIPDGDYLLFDMTDEFHRNKSEKPKSRVLVLVRAKIYVQKEEEELLGVSKEDQERPAVVPE